MIRILSTILPFDGVIPDYSGVPSYALGALQKAFVNNDYEIIPDPEPIEELPLPDWDAFNAYMLTDPMFKSYRNAVRPLDGDLNSALFDSYGLVSTNGIAAFSLVWGVWAQVSQITPEDKLVIAGVATMCNLPSDFVSVLRGN